MGLVEGVLDDAANLFIDFARGLLAVVALFAEVAAQEDQFVLVA